MAWDMGPSGYTYNDFGALSSITNGSNTYRYTYTLQGQVDSLLLGVGVREKRSWDDDGRLLAKIRASDSVALIVSDSLKYDKADHVVRAWEEAYNHAADSTRISYDGLGGVLAREQGNSLGVNVEEFRNDAFGNVTRRRTLRTAGLVNTAPYTLCANVDAMWVQFDTLSIGATQKVAILPGLADSVGTFAPGWIIGWWTNMTGSSSYWVGIDVDKVGRTTGWTRGQLSATCQTVTDVATSSRTLCADEVTGPARLIGDADSGSPVFVGHDSTNTAIGRLGIQFYAIMGTTANSPDGPLYCTSGCSYYYNRLSRVSLFVMLPPY
jgi:hypothetical protein